MRKLAITVFSVLCVAAGSAVWAEVEPSNEAVEAWNGYVESFAANDYDAAETHLQKAIELEPEWVKPYLELGQLQNQRKKFGPAAASLVKATELDGANATAFLYLGNAYAAQEVYSKAYVALNRALKLDASLVEARKLLATCYFDDGDYENARTQYTAYLAEKPDDAKAMLRLAESNKKLKKVGPAIKAYKQAIAADPKMFAAHYNLGNLYLENSDFSESEAALREAVKLEPKNFRAHFNLAIAIHSQSRLKDALAVYEEVVKVGGNSRSAKSTVAAAKETIKGLKGQIAAGAN